MKFLKHFLAIFLVATLTLVTTAAFSQNKIYNLKPTKTTLSGTDTTYLTAAYVGAHETASFQYVHDKLTGTVGGSVILEVSNNGTTWTTIGEDTLTLTNVAQTQKIWSITPFNYRSARLKVLTSGSQTSQASCTAYFIHPK